MIDKAKFYIFDANNKMIWQRVWIQDAQGGGDPNQSSRLHRPFRDLEGLPPSQSK